MQAWDDIVARHTQGVIAAPKGQANSVENFIARLKPLRHTFREYVQALATQIQPYASLKIRIADFWQRSRKGASFKGYIWMYAASAKDKTLGRLQITFCPEGVVRSEYVSYPKTELTRAFHIERLSSLMQSAEWFAEYKRGCQALPPGFLMETTTGNGLRISSEMRHVTSAQWASLNKYGLDINQYFVIAIDRHRDLLRHMTANELAELLVGDWECLGGLWPLLQDIGTSLANLPSRKVSAIVEATRRLTIPALHSFSPESLGPRASYTISDSIQATRIHGIIVNALSQEIQNLGHRVVNDQARDLAILNAAGLVEALFEVKTDSSTSSIYTGVGQLFLHSANDIPEPHRVLVLPSAVNDTIGGALHKIGIHVLLYSLHGEQGIPTFEALPDMGRVKS